MLPDHILNHPYCHANLDLNTAKEKLLQSADGQGNFLFCKGSTEKDILLVYKAYFRGAAEVRNYALYYNSVEKEVKGVHGLVELCKASLLRHENVSDEELDDELDEGYQP